LVAIEMTYFDVPSSADWGFGHTIELVIGGHVSTHQTMVTPS